MQKSLFSDTVSGELQHVTRRIPAAKTITAFRSTPTGYDDNNTKGWASYDMAWQSPRTGLWTVENHRIFIEDGAATLDQKKTVASDMCFFDALYYCGFAETSRLAAGEKPREDGLEHTHYKQAAATAYQPLDMSGLPHPAAEGRILTDGLFDQKQMAIAARTAKTQLVPVEAAPVAKSAHSFLDMVGNADVTQDTTAMAMDSLLSKEQMKSRIEQTERLLAYELRRGRNSYPFVTELKKDISPKIDFSSGPHYRDAVQLIGHAFQALGGIFWGIGLLLFVPMQQAMQGALLTAAAIQGTTTAVKLLPTLYKGAKSAIKKVHHNVKVNRNINALPDSALKQQVIDHRNTIRAAAHFMKAAALIENHGYDSKKILKKVFKEITRGADCVGMSALEVQQLKSLVLSKNFPNEYAFHKKACESEDRLGRATRDFKNGIDNGTVAVTPSLLEHKPEIQADFVTEVPKNKVFMPR